MGNYSFWNMEGHLEESRDECWTSQSIHLPQFHNMDKRLERSQIPNHWPGCIEPSAPLLLFLIIWSSQYITLWAFGQLQLCIFVTCQSPDTNFKVSSNSDVLCFILLCSKKLPEMILVGRKCNIKQEWPRSKLWITWNLSLSFPFILLSSRNLILAYHL